MLLKASRKLQTLLVPPYTCTVHNNSTQSKQTSIVTYNHKYFECLLSPSCRCCMTSTHWPGTITQPKEQFLRAASLVFIKQTLLCPYCIGNLGTMIHSLILSLSTLFTHQIDIQSFTKLGVHH